MKRRAISEDQYEPDKCDKNQRGANDFFDLKNVPKMNANLK